MTDIDADLRPTYSSRRSWVFRHVAMSPFPTPMSSSRAFPSNLATAGRAGTREGPTSDTYGLTNLSFEPARWPWTFELKQALKVEDAGDIYGQTGVPATMVESVEQRTDAILAAGKRVMSFGGDHYVALPLLRSIARHHGPVSLLHFDAHTDTYEGADYNHGTMFYHAVEEGLIDPQHSLQVGIRTDYDRNNHAFEVLGAPTGSTTTARSRPANGSSR